MMEYDVSLSFSVGIPSAGKRKKERKKEKKEERKKERKKERKSMP